MKTILILSVYFASTTSWALNCTAKGSIDNEKYEKPLIEKDGEQLLEFKGYSFMVSKEEGGLSKASILNKKTLALTGQFSNALASNFLTGKSMTNGDVVSLECKKLPLNLKKGDIVKDKGGEIIDTPQRAMEMYQKIKGQESIDQNQVIGVERNKHSLIKNN